MKKFLVWIGSALVIGLIILGVVAVLSLNKGVKAGVESIGPRLTKSDVRLDQVKLSLLSGSGVLKGLVIGNPEGFKTPHAISVGSTTLQIAPASLMSDKIVVRKIEVIAPEVTVEAGMGGINLSKLLSNVQEATGSSGTAKPKEEPAPTAGKSSKKFQVDEFRITRAKVRVEIPDMKGQAPREATLEDIHLTNLGSGPEGITAAELTQLALAALTVEALKVAANELPEYSQKLSEVTGMSTNQINQIGKGISDLLKGSKPK